MMQPLHLAARNGHTEVASMLLKQKTFDINSKSGGYGKTALMWACENGCEDVVKLLLSREDIEVNAKDDDGRTALMFACDNGHEGVVKLLRSSVGGA
jgi:ankyrin repeat protein